MRVLVTGVSGFVGAHLVRALHGRGDRVVGVGLDPPSPTIGSLLETFLPADLTVPESLVTALQGALPDVVVHLAAQSSAGDSFRRPSETFQVNVVGTWAVLEAVRRVAPSARTIIVGTGEVYGPQPEGTRVREDAAFHPVSPYALSKAVGDATAEMIGRTHGLDVVRTRSFGHLGPGQDTRFLLPSVAKQIAQIESGAAPVVRVGNLEMTRDLCDVRDVVNAYIGLIDRGRSGIAYNVCRGIGVRLVDVVRELLEQARVPIQLVVEPDRVRPADLPYLVGDPSRIEAEIGWRAGSDLKRALSDILAEWRHVTTRD